MTATSMYRMTDKFKSDLRGMAGMSLAGFFRRVANMRYKKDPRGIERVSRPKWSFLLARRGGIDCKKKAILMAGYLALNGIPYRFVGASTLRPLFGRPKIHHVFTQGYFCGADNVCKWRNVDATYSKYRLFAPKPELTRAVIFGRPPV